MGDADTVYTLPDKCKTYHIVSEVSSSRILSWLQQGADEDVTQRYLSNDELVDLGIQIAVNDFLDHHEDMRGKVLVMPAAAAEHLTAGRDKDFWNAVQQGSRRLAQYKLQDYKIIIIPFGGKFIKYHWSLIWLNNPFAPYAERSKIKAIFIDSLGRSGHYDRDLARQVEATVNAARANLGLQEVLFPCLLAEKAPQQPKGSNACGYFTIYNAACMLHNESEGRSPESTNDFQLCYHPINPLLMLEQVILPAVQHIIDSDSSMQQLAGKIKSQCPFALSGAQFHWPAAQNEGVLQAHTSIAQLDMPAAFIDLGISGRLRSRSGSRGRSQSPGAALEQAGRGRGTGRRSASRDSTVATGDLEMEQAEAAEDLKELNSSKHARPGSRSDRRSLASAWKSQSAAASTGDAAGLQALEAKLNGFLAPEQGDNELAPAGNQLLIQTLNQLCDLQRETLAEQRIGNEKLDTLIGLQQESMRQVAVSQASKKVADNTEAIKTTSKQMFAEEPYPRDDVMTGGAIQLHGVRNMDEMKEKLKDPSGAECIIMLKATRSQLGNYLRTNTRGKARSVTREAACVFFGLPLPKNGSKKYPSLDEKQTAEQLKDDAYIGGATYNSKLFLAVLLAVYNFVHGANLAGFGAGGVMTKMFYGEIAYAEMELRRWLQGDVGEAPKKGAKNTMGDKGVELAKLFQERLELLKDALRGGKCELESKCSIELAGSERVGRWLSLANTMSDSDKEMVKG